MTHIVARAALGTAGLTAAALVSTLTGPPASATPGSGATSTILAQGTTDSQVHVEANGSTRIVFQRVTLQRGGYTGWHTHPGPLLVVVESGTLTHYDKTCGVATYAAGQAFEETPREVHMGANHGTEPVVLDVTYVVPGDGPLREDASAPACTAELL